MDGKLADSMYDKDGDVSFGAIEAVCADAFPADGLKSLRTVVQRFVFPKLRYTVQVYPSLPPQLVGSEIAVTVHGDVRDQLFECSVFKSMPTPLVQGLFSGPTEKSAYCDCPFLADDAAGQPRALATLSPHQRGLLEELSQLVEIIIGPPGTGKSRTVCGLVAALPQLEKRFTMLVAPTNVAIEANCEILDHNGVKFLGAPSHGNGTLAERHTLFAQVKDTEVYTKFVESCSVGKPDFHELGELLQDELASAQVFLSTVHHTMSPAEHLERARMSIADDVGLSSQDAYGILKATASPLGAYRCDTFIVDEAGAVSCQALISELMHMDPRRVVLAGDPRQARPFSSHDKHAPSLLEVLNHYREDCSGFENPAALCEVWRMGPINTRMVSDVCYSM